MDQALNQKIDAFIAANKEQWLKDIEALVSINSVEDNIADVTVNGTQYEVEIEGKTSKVIKVTKPTPASTSAATTAEVISTAKAAAKKSAGAAVKSPLPGVIVDIKVRQGDRVTAGQHLLVLEAMKMENNIDADRDGIIVELKVNKGDSVLVGDTLLTIG